MGYLLPLKVLGSRGRTHFLGLLEKGFEEPVLQVDRVQVVGDGVDHGDGAASVADGLVHEVEVLGNLEGKVNKIAQVLRGKDQEKT